MAAARRGAMGAGGATNNRPSMEEEVTTVSLRATTAPLHKATASRASMDRVEVEDTEMKVHQ